MIAAGGQRMMNRRETDTIMITVSWETLEYYRELEDRIGIPYKRLIRQDLNRCAAERRNTTRPELSTPDGAFLVSHHRRGYEQDGEYMDYFEVTVVVDELDVSKRVCSLAQVMDAVGSMAVKYGLTRSDAGELPNAAAYRYNQDDPKSLAMAYNFTSDVKERLGRALLTSLSFYDSYEDQLDYYVAPRSGEETV